MRAASTSRHQTENHRSVGRITGLEGWLAPAPAREVVDQQERGQATLPNRDPFQRPLEISFTIRDLQFTIYDLRVTIHEEETRGQPSECWLTYWLGHQCIDHIP